jgi:hypothetical protein
LLLGPGTNPLDTRNGTAVLAGPLQKDPLRLLTRKE